MSAARRVATRSCSSTAARSAIASGCRIGSSRAPNAAAVLGAAIGNCLAASLTYCLRRARMDVQEMTAEVTTHVAKNEHGRFRVSEIDVELKPVLGAATGTPRW